MKSKSKEWQAVVNHHAAMKKGEKGVKRNRKPREVNLHHLVSHNRERLDFDLSKKAADSEESAA